MRSPSPGGTRVTQSTLCWGYTVSWWWEQGARKGLLGVGSLWAGKHVGGTKGAAGGGEGRQGLPQDPQGRAQARMMRAVSRGGGGPQGSAGSTCAQDKHRYVSTGVSNSSLTLTSTTRYSWMVGTVAPLSLH